MFLSTLLSVIKTVYSMYKRRLEMQDEINRFVVESCGLDAHFENTVDMLDFKTVSAIENLDMYQYELAKKDDLHDELIRIGGSYKIQEAADEINMSGVSKHARSKAVLDHAKEGFRLKNKQLAKERRKDAKLLTDLIVESHNERDYYVTKKVEDFTYNENLIQEKERSYFKSCVEHFEDSDLRPMNVHKTVKVTKTGFNVDTQAGNIQEFEFSSFQPSNMLYAILNRQLA